MGHDSPICRRLYNQYHLHLLQSTILNCYHHKRSKWKKKKKRSCRIERTKNQNQRKRIMAWPQVNSRQNRTRIMIVMIPQGLAKLLRQQQQGNKVQNHHSSEPFAISSFQSVSSGQKLVIGTQSLCGVPPSEDLVTTQIGLWTSIQVCHFECGYCAIWSQNPFFYFFPGWDGGAGEQ